MRTVSFALLCLLCACSGKTTTKKVLVTEPGAVDVDEDGIAEDADCDDSDPDVGTGSQWYLDEDGDGIGLTDSAMTACEAPRGYVAANGDCDDEDSDVYPGAPEVWYDDIDQDCQGDSDWDQDGDGATDLGAPSGSADDCDDANPSFIAETTWYQDCDGDGLFSDTTVTACGDPRGTCPGPSHPTGYTALMPSTFDCDDTDRAITAPATWYYDCDGDGLFAGPISNICSPAADTTTCADAAAPDDYTQVAPGNVDCDDSNSEATVARSWYYDCDGDGAFALQGGACHPSTDTLTCNGAVPVSFRQTPPATLDCDDEDIAVVAEAVWYPDCDSDAAFAASGVVACGADGADAAFDCADSGDPDGGWSSTMGADCEDEDPSRAALEVWYPDCDGDGQYDDAGVTACGAAGADAAFTCDDGGAPDGGWDTTAGTDCDDEDAGSVAATTWYADCDGDGVFASEGVQACGLAGADAATPCDDTARPDGGWSATAGTDCDDENGNASTAADWYPDCDGDTLFDDAAVNACGIPGANLVFDCALGGDPVAWSSVAGVDCDDDASLASLAKTWWYDCDGDGGYEPHDGICNPSIDNTTCSDAMAPDVWSETDPGSPDCNDNDAAATQVTAWYADCDQDSESAADAVMACGKAGADAAFDCEDGSDPTLWVSAAGTDCNDEDPTAQAAAVWYPDCDDDSSHSNQGVLACGADGADTLFTCVDGAVPDGGWSTTAGSDCDDENLAASGPRDWFADCDGDGEHAPQGIFACGQAGADAAFDCLDGSDPVWAITPGTDCNDEDAGAQAMGAFYADCDGDSVATSVQVMACGTTGADAAYDCVDGADPDGGWATTAGTDCNDEDAAAQAMGAFYADCDGDTVATSVQVMACGTTGADAAYDCVDGADPDGGWATTAGTDCDDEDAGAAAMGTFYADCDGDGAAASVAVNACGTTGADAAFDCLDGSDPDGGWATSAGTDCNDEDAAATTLGMHYPDCDGDGTAAASGVTTCGVAAADAAFDCVDGSDPSQWLGAAGTDCDDEDGSVSALAAWYPDCDGDSEPSDVGLLACGSAAADASFDCIDGADPDGGWSSSGGTDCDDEDNSGQAYQTRYPDCDGDGASASVAVWSCSTADANDVYDCLGGGDPSTWETTDDADCNDDDAFAQAIATYYPDCDGDGVTADQPVVACGIRGADAAWDCAAGGNPAGWDTANDADCDDTDGSASAVETLWIDCDADGGYAINPIDACGSRGACPGGANADTHTNSDPGVYDCSDGDVSSVYCEDCADVLLAMPSATDGNYMVAGDGSVAPFLVTCNMSSGGYMDVTVDTTVTTVMTDGVIMAEDTSGDGSCTPDTGNPWCKCADDSSQYYVDYGLSGDADVAADGVGSTTHTFDLTYQTAAGVLTAAQYAALAGVLNEMAPGNAMVAVVSDDDSQLYETNGAQGHEVSVVDHTGAVQLLTDGENGDCGSGVWPAAGTESGYWFWHTDPAENSTAGMFDAANLPAATRPGLPGSFTLPAQVVLDIYTGGGASFGWEYRTLQVRRAPRSCYEAMMLDGGYDGVRRIDPDGQGAFDAYCDMHTDGGGWTLLGTIHGADANNWNKAPGDAADAWGTTSVQLGSAASPFTGDYKGPAWNRLNVQDSEIMFERSYDDVVRAQMGLSNSCLFGVSRFTDLFTDWNNFQTPCDLSEIRQIMGAADATGVRAGYVEGADTSAMGGAGTNGFCWNGGDDDNNSFQGRAGWNQSTYPGVCYDAGHLGYIGVFNPGSAQYSGIDVDESNWLRNVDTTRVSIQLWAR